MESVLSSVENFSKDKVSESFLRITKGFWNSFYLVFDHNNLQLGVKIVIEFDCDGIRFEIKRKSKKVFTNCVDNTFFDLNKDEENRRKQIELS